MATLLIDDTYLKDNSPLGRSFDIDEIYPFVYQAQSIYTQDVLGTPLYKDILIKTDNYISGTGPTFSANEWDLVELLSKALVYWTVYLALPHIMIKTRNAGVVKDNSERTTGSDLTEMKYIREEMKNLGEFWNQRIVNFICERSQSFPLYNAKSDDMYPSNRQYDSDIYIEDGISDLTWEELRFIKKYLS